MHELVFERNLPIQKPSPQKKFRSIWQSFLDLQSGIQMQDANLAAILNFGRSWFYERNRPLVKPNRHKKIQVNLPIHSCVTVRNTKSNMSTWRPSWILLGIIKWKQISLGNQLTDHKMYGIYRKHGEYCTTDSGFWERGVQLWPCHLKIIFRTSLQDYAAAIVGRRTWVFNEINQSCRCCKDWQLLILFISSKTQVFFKCFLRHFAKINISFEESMMTKAMKI
jgi:hypothetical protein